MNGGHTTDRRGFVGQRRIRRARTATKGRGLSANSGNLSCGGCGPVALAPGERCYPQHLLHPLSSTSEIGSLSRPFEAFAGVCVREHACMHAMAVAGRISVILVQDHLSVLAFTAVALMTEFAGVRACRRAWPCSMAKHYILLKLSAISGRRNGLRSAVCASGASAMILREMHLNCPWAEFQQSLTQLTASAPRPACALQYVGAALRFARTRKIRASTPASRAAGAGRCGGSGCAVRGGGRGGSHIRRLRHSPQHEARKAELLLAENGHGVNRDDVGGLRRTRGR